MRKKHEGKDLEKIIIRILSIILGSCTCQIFIGFFWTCTILGIIGLIIGLFYPINWIIDSKKRRGRRSKKKHIKIMRISFVLFSAGIIFGVCYERNAINEKFNAWSEGISEYAEVFLNEKGKLGLKPNRLGITQKLLNNTYK